jgi:hypothetical protein
MMKKGAAFTTTLPQWRAIMGSHSIIIIVKTKVQTYVPDAINSREEMVWYVHEEVYHRAFDAAHG